MRFRPGGCAGNGAGPTRIRARLCGQSQGPACVRELMTIATRGQAAPPTFCRPPPVAAITVFRWPPGPKIRALAGRLRRAQTFLRALGIEVAFGREGRAGSRVIRMRTTFAHTVSTVSSVRHEGSGAGSNRPQTADGIRDNKYRPNLIGPCSIGQASVTAADDADGADANAASSVG